MLDPLIVADVVARGWAEVSKLSIPPVK